MPSDGVPAFVMLEQSSVEKSCCVDEASVASMPIRNISMIVFIAC